MERVDVGQLGPEVTKFSWEVSPASLGLDNEPGFKNPLTIELGLRKVEFRDRKEVSVIVEGTVTTRLALKCSRCLEEFEAAVNAGFRSEYMEGPPRQHPEDVVRDDDPDVWYFEAPFMDLRDDLRQVALMAGPEYPVCRPDCRGLCALCGRNLNTAPCECGRLVKYRPFEGLKNLIEKEKNEDG